MPLHARLVHDWAASWVKLPRTRSTRCRSARGLVSGLPPNQECHEASVTCYHGRRVGAARGSLAVVAVKPPWSGRGETIVVARENRKSGRCVEGLLRTDPPPNLVRAPPKPRRQPTRCLMAMLPVVRRACEAPGAAAPKKSRGNEDKS